MKKIMTTIIVFIIICMMTACSGGTNTEKEPVSSKLPDASTPAATSGQAVTEEEAGNVHQPYIKSSFTDMAGKEQVLDLGRINMQNKMLKVLRGGSATEYSQLKDGHYYYLKQDKSGKYIILYRDKGEQVAKIKCNMEKEVIQGAVLGDDELYLLYCDGKVLRDKYEDSLFLKCANLQTGSADVISLEYDFDSEYWITDEYIYSCGDLDVNDWNCFNKTTGRVNFNRCLAFEENDFLTDPKYKQIIDGKLYYIIGDVYTPDAPHSFIQIDLEKQERKVLLEYMPGLEGGVSVGLVSMDEEGIYVCESNDKDKALYKIPLHGGEMEKMESYAWDSRFSSYQDHSIYIDQKNRMHVVDRKKKTDTVIGNNFKEKIYSFTCAEEGVFITCYADWIEEADNDNLWGHIWKNDISLALYYMDYNGENLTQLRKEVGP